MSDETGGTPAPTSQKPRSRTWVRVLLVLSLGFNFLILGLVSGAYMFHAKNPNPDRAAPETRMMLDLGLGPFLNAFAPEQRREIGSALRREVGNPTAGREALATELAIMLDVLRADPFDQATFEAVLETQRTRLTARTEAGREVLLEAVAGMSNTQRADFADRLERSLRRAVQNFRDRAGGRP